jgi:hypothetical protein
VVQIKRKSKCSKKFSVNEPNRKRSVNLKLIDYFYRQAHTKQEESFKFVRKTRSHVGLAYYQSLDQYVWVGTADLNVN